MRIQILPLPTVVAGDVVDEPFAIVVDQCRYDDPNLMSPHAAEAARRRWKLFGDECFAAAVLVTDETVEIVDRYAEPDTSEIDKLAGYLLEHFGDEIGEGSAVDNAIRLLGGILLRRDAVKIRDEIRFMQAARQEKSGDEARRRAESDRIDNDRLRLEIDRLRGIVSRMVSIPRWPENAPDNETGRAYTQGWQACRALVDKALLPEDSVIHKPSVVDEEIHNGDEGRG